MVATICRRFEVGWDQTLRPLGLDSTMDQVRKDAPRDSFTIGGDFYKNIQGDVLVNLILQKLLVRWQSRVLYGRAAVMAGGLVGERNGWRPVLDAALPS